MYMGAYTADVNVVQNLAAAGLPVWLLRVPAELSKEVVVLKEASTVIFPSHINTEIGDFAIDPIFMDYPYSQL
ncbi:hypothetical protein EW026_g842 [Hermanssonia centrifuga]|uniref:Uncharacterized protein n=1 Tax=Hermanssonia centrifuga TaxID=98765 RepID=A0A4S4KY05_9APHY|nr:hypothetical protein EW026_g842 [Hermanssonia centrifuga]